MEKSILTCYSLEPLDGGIIGDFYFIIVIFAKFSFLLSIVLFGRQSDRMREAESSCIHWFLSQTAAIASSEPDQNHGPGIPSKASTWVARTQAPGPSAVAFPGTLTWKRMCSGATRTQPFTLIGDLLTPPNSIKSLYYLRHSEQQHLFLNKRAPPLDKAP